MNEPQLKICLFGGTFDPIHLGHTFIAQQAVSQLGLDKVIFLPCKQSPHKLARKAAAADERLKMCQLATSALTWAEVSDYDLTAPSPSYSWRTAEHFRSLYPNAQLFWLMGTDQWQAIERWDRAQYFSSLLTIVVYSRESAQKSQSQFKAIHLNTFLHPASATSIREKLKKFGSSNWLYPKVHQWLKENHTY